MNEHIKYLEVANYKSVNNIKLNCRRINVFIGQPNVGKSNILEAINLMYLSWLFTENAEKSKAIAKKIYRADDVKSLFRGYDDKKIIAIKGYKNGTFNLSIRKNKKNNYDYNLAAFPSGEMELSNDFIRLSRGGGATTGGVQPYYYRTDVDFNNEGNYTNLKPPYGSNLIHVLESNEELRSQFDKIFLEFGYRIRIERQDERLLIIRDEQNGFVFSVPFQAISDTLKRLMFYVAAIRSNQEHCLVFEEPEVHSFPPYISLLGDEIIKSIENQFFIVTHSPYLLNNLIENTPEDELQVFVCGYDTKKYETIVRPLSSKDLSELLDFGVDIFFNINRYLLDDRVEHSS